MYSFSQKKVLPESKQSEDYSLTLPKIFIMDYKDLEKKQYSVDEYLQLEAEEGIRYEFFNGEVFAMEGTSKTHYKIQCR